MPEKKRPPTRLRYTGPDPAEVGVVPLPEGWPAVDHDEPDAAQRAAKLASGAYAPAPARGEEE